MLNRRVKFVKFLLLGGFTYFVAIISTHIFVGVFCLSNAIAYALTQCIIFSINFIIAKKWVFQSSKQGYLRQAVLYLCVACSFRFADWALFVILMETLSPSRFIAIFLSLSIVFPAKFIIYDKRVFNE